MEMESNNSSHLWEKLEQFGKTVRVSLHKMGFLKLAASSQDDESKNIMLGS